MGRGRYPTHQACCAIIASTGTGDSSGGFPSLRRKPEVAKPGDVLEHQRVTGQLVSKPVAQNPEDLQLANDVFDQDPLGGVLAVACLGVTHLRVEHGLDQPNTHGSPLE